MRQYTITVGQLLMLKRVLGFTLGAGNVTITDSIMAFSDAITLLKTKVADLDTNLEYYTTVIIGLAQQKAQARKELAALTATVMSSTRSYAITNGNLDLAAKMNTTLAKIENMAYKRIMAFVNDAIATVSPIVGSLANYNVTPATITTWKGLRDTMAAWLSVPQVAISTRKAYGQTINNQMKETMEFVKTTVDTLTLNFKETYPVYYASYWTNRKLIHTGVRHTGLEATIVNELGEPIVGATVIVDELQKDNKTYKAVSDTTDINGFVHLSTFESGLRTVTVEGPSIVSKTFGPFQFVHGEILTETFTVQPSFENLPQTEQPKETTPVK